MAGAKDRIGVSTVVQGLVLVALVGSNLWLTSRVSALETRLAETAAVAAAADVRAAARPRAIKGDRPARAVVTASPAVVPAGTSGSPVDAAVVDDHLWSEEGRAAIDDVVAEREEREGERRAQRWIAMRDARNAQVIEQVSEKLSLSEEDSEELRGIVEDFMERRGEIWQAMKSEGEVDMAALVRQSDQDKADFDADLVELLGDEGATLVQESFGKRGF